jgi:hypothetical protein
LTAGKSVRRKSQTPKQKQGKKEKMQIAESSDPRPKIDVDKENAVRQAQPVNV